MKSDRQSALWILRAAILFLVCCGWSAAADAEEFDDIQIISESRRSANNGAHGYALYNFMVSNRSPSKKYEVELRIPGDDYRSIGPSSRIRGLSKKFEVAPNSTVYVPLYQPALRMSGSGVGVYINGRKQKSNINLRLGDHGAYPSTTSMRGIPNTATSWISAGARSGMFEPRVLISYSADESDLRKIASLSRVGPPGSPIISSPGFSRGPTMTLTIPPSRPGGTRIGPSTGGIANVEFINASGFEPNWLSYSSYDGCVLALSDAQGLAPNELSALWQYIECGGSVAVMGEGDLPDAWADLDPQLADQTLDNDSFQRYRVGMGHLFLTGPPDQLLANNPTAAAEITNSWAQSGHAWGTLPTASGANASLPMAKQLDSEASLRQMFIAMLAFAVLIGPINLIVLAKRKRRSWIFWTTPAVSALACGAVFLYAAFSEGWGQHTRYAFFTALDQDVNRAATIGLVGFYSPMSDSSGLKFEDSTEVTPLIFGDTVSGSVDWSDGQHFKGDWVRARIPRHFKLRKNETRRERINLRRDGGELRIVNGVGADIKSLVYIDHDGRRYQASDIPKGKEAPLNEITDLAPVSVPLRKVYATRDWHSSIADMRDRPLQYLSPGQYLAELKENVFVEEALDGAKAKPTSIAMLMGEMSDE